MFDELMLDRIVQSVLTKLPPERQVKIYETRDRLQQIIDEAGEDVGGFAFELLRQVMSQRARESVARLQAKGGNCPHCGKELVRGLCPSLLSPFPNASGKPE